METMGRIIRSDTHRVTIYSDLQHQRPKCSASFRAMRETELRAMAHHAADRVRSTGLPFFFGPMNASERRIIHLTLADDSDLFTESIGEGNSRRLKVSLKTPIKN